MSTFVQQIFTIKSWSCLKPNKCERFLAPNFFSGGTTPRLLYGRLLAQFTVHRLAKFGWIPFADLRLRVGENLLPICSRLWTKFHVVLRRCGRPLVVCKHLRAYVYCVSFRRYRPLNLPLSCEVVQKVVFGPLICWSGYTPDFGHAFLNCTHFRPRGRFSLSFVQRARRVADQ